MKTFPIAKFNGARGADELVIYNVGETTGTNSYGLEACVVNGRVIRYGNNNNAVPEGGFVVSGHGKAARFIADALCLGAKAEIDKENGVFNAEIDSRALEIAAEMQLPEEDVVFALEAIQDPLSFSDPVYQEGGDAIYVADQIRDTKVSEDDWVRDLSIKNAISHLQQREKRIIQQRFFQGKTQMEVASEIGISQAQVSRLEKAALKQMQKYI